MNDNEELFPGVKFDDGLSCIKIILKDDFICNRLMDVMKDWSNKEKFERWSMYKDIRVYIFLLKNALIKNDMDTYCKILIQMVQKYEEAPFITILSIGSKYVDTYETLSIMEENVEKGIASEQNYLDMCKYMKICHSITKHVLGKE